MAEESANPPAGGQFRHSSPWAKYNSLSEEGHGSFGPAPETCVKDPGVRDEAGGFERAPLCWHVATMQCFGAPKTTLLDGRGNEWEALFPLGLVDRVGRGLVFGRDCLQDAMRMSGTLEGRSCPARCTLEG